MMQVYMSRNGILEAKSLFLVISFNTPTMIFVCVILERNGEVQLNLVTDVHL